MLLDTSFHWIHWTNILHIYVCLSAGGILGVLEGIQTSNNWPGKRTFWCLAFLSILCPSPSSTHACIFVECNLVNYRISQSVLNICILLLACKLSLSRQNLSGHWCPATSHKAIWVWFRGEECQESRPWLLARRRLARACMLGRVQWEVGTLLLHFLASKLKSKWRKLHPL